MKDPMLTPDEIAILRAAQNVIDRVIGRQQVAEEGAPSTPGVTKQVAGPEAEARAQRVMDGQAAWVDLESGETAHLVSQETEWNKGKGYEGYVAYRYEGAHGVFTDAIADFVERFEPKE